jgi:hypothetical protein
MLCKGELKTRNIARYEETSQSEKGANSPRNIAIKYAYAQKSRDLKYMQQNWIELRRSRNKSTGICGYSSTSISIIDIKGTRKN